MAKIATTDRLYDEIMALSAEDRALLLDRLWDAEWRAVPGFEHPIEDEEYWREEIARRAAELRADPSAGSSLEDVVNRARNAVRAHARH